MGAMIRIQHRMDSIIPKQCSAITIKGKRCRNQAIAGAAKCKIHTRPSPTDPTEISSNFKKVALQAFLDAVVKIGIQKVIEYIALLINPQFAQSLAKLKRPSFLNKPPEEVTIEELGDWFNALPLEWQKRVGIALTKFLERKEQHSRTNESA